MATRKQPDPPKIHPVHGTTAPSSGVPTNLATSIPETGTLYAGEYGANQVTYRLDSVGRRVIVTPSNLAGVVF